VSTFAFRPGDLVVEKRDGDVIAYYIITDQHYLDGCNMNQVLGYSSIVVYSTNEKRWYRHHPGSYWFIKQSDSECSDFDILVKSDLKW
tara:strand:+ start:1086 stop:1349 length:264 start_codon:yes stop_codon:yes gene_type:complete